MDTAILREDSAGLSSVTKNRRIPDRRRVIIDTAVLADDQKALTSVTRNLKGGAAPSCKVVLREGQGGARIDPKGCKVRTKKTASGATEKTDKHGKTKRKIKETGSQHWVTVARSGNGMGPHIEMLWDTGAEDSVLSRESFIKIKDRRYRGTPTRGRIQGVSELTDVVIYENFPIYVKHGDDDYQKIRITARVMPGDSLDLLGRDGIRQLKRYRVKFV